MTVKNFSIRQKIGEKCISKNAPIIPVTTGQNLVLCLLPGMCLTVPWFSPRGHVCSALKAEGWRGSLETQILFFQAPKSLWTVTSATKLKDASWKENYDKTRQHIKKQRHHFLTKSCIVKAMVFSSSHVLM